MRQCKKNTCVHVSVREDGGCLGGVRVLSRVSREHRELVAVTAVMLPDASRTGQGAFCVNAHSAPVTPHVWSCSGTKGGEVCSLTGLELHINFNLYTQTYIVCWYPAGVSNGRLICFSVSVD